MKILVLTGSPHKKGTSAMMADYFIEGAKSSGNEVVRLDTAFMNINSCLGCGYCRKNSEKCVQDDDMRGNGKFSISREGEKTWRKYKIEEDAEAYEKIFHINLYKI